MIGRIDDNKGMNLKPTPQSKNVVGYSVAYKVKNRRIQLIGFFMYREGAARHAKLLRESWADQSVQRPGYLVPTSIRVRKCTELEWLRLRPNS